MPGKYSITMIIASNDIHLDYISNALNFSVLPSRFFDNGYNVENGKIYVEQEWKVIKHR